MNSSYPAVAKRAAHRCEYCLAPEVIFNFPFEVEHVIPTSRHGSDDDSNLALSCHACNLYKSNRLTGTDEVAAGEVRLFNPRSDRWEDHFEVVRDTGEIRGLTSLGRATVAGLRMNAPAQVRARQKWIRWGIFP